MEFDDETLEPHMTKYFSLPPFFHARRSISAGLQLAGHALGWLLWEQTVVFQERCRMRVTESSEANGRRRGGGHWAFFPHFSVAHRMVIPRLAEQMVNCPEM
jgi:hypothetical protein